MDNGTLNSGTAQDLLSRSLKYFVKNAKLSKGDPVDFYIEEQDSHPDLPGKRKVRKFGKVMEIHPDSTISVKSDTGRIYRLSSSEVSFL